MLSLLIPETKDFMKHLLIENIFDNFSIVEANISTSISTSIDGHINKEFFSKDELETLNIENREYMPWSIVKPLCFNLIKGKNTPTYFRITLSLSEDSVENVIKQTKINISPEQIKGLLVNFKYDGKHISCTTATSLKIFTLDKTLDNEWDLLFEKFLKKHEIISTQL